ncbi:unnamed protein product, partial [Vitis vinifera]
MTKLPELIFTHSHRSQSSLSAHRQHLLDSVRQCAVEPRARADRLLLQCAGESNAFRAVSGSFEFEFSSRFSSDGKGPSGSMSSADELFLNGQIRPMKLSSHLQRPQILAPLMDLEGEEEDEESKDDLCRLCETQHSEELESSSEVLKEKEKGKQRQKGSKQASTKKSGSGKPTNGVAAKRRVPPSPHELHYTANRAQAEEMKKRTFLPYRQGLLGCLGFSSKGYAMYEPPLLVLLHQLMKLLASMHMICI